MHEEQERAADLRRKLAALPWRDFEVAPGVYTRYVHQGEMLDAFDAARASLAKPQPVGGALTADQIDDIATQHGAWLVLREQWLFTNPAMIQFARDIEAATLSAPVAQPGEAVPRRPSAPAAQPEQGCRWPWLHCGSTSPCDICTPPVAGVTRCQHCGGCGELFQHDGRSAGECPHCADAAQPAAALPRSYRSSVLVTGNDNSTEGAKVSFYFNEVADAYAWYEAITEAAPAQAAAVPEAVDLTAQRKKFMNWACDEFKTVHVKGDGFKEHDVRAAWLGWKAALATPEAGAGGGNP
jgi:hypothetical protein